MPPVLNDPIARGEYVHHLDEAHRRGLITWESVTIAQEAVMPRCEACQTAPMIDSGTGLCGGCFVARLQGALPSGESSLGRRR